MQQSDALKGYEGRSDEFSCECGKNTAHLPVIGQAEQGREEKWIGVSCLITGT